MKSLWIGQQRNSNEVVTKAPILSYYNSMKPSVTVQSDHKPLESILKKQLKAYTSSDEHIQQLRAMIMDGWPTEKKDLPHEVAPYFP